MIGARMALAGLVASGLGLAPVAVAAAEPDTRVLVLPVQLEGELPPDTADEIRTVLRDNLVDDGFELVEDEARCPDAACRRGVAAQVQADYVVTAEITGNEDEFTVAVIVSSGQTGEPLESFGEACSICGLVEVRDMSRMTALDARAELVRRRTLAVERPRPVAPAPPVRPVDHPTRPRRLMATGFILTGAGAATTIGGTVLLALHHQGAGCLDDPHGGECVRVRYTTGPAGAIVGAVGVVTLTAGVVMLVMGRRASRAETARLSARSSGIALRF